MSEGTHGIVRGAAGRWLRVLTVVMTTTLAVGCAADAEESATVESPLSGPAAQAVQDLERANDRQRDDNAALARQLGQLDLALTEAQKKDYAKAYFDLREVEETNAARERAAKALGESLEKIMASPAELAKVLRPTTNPRVPVSDGGLYRAFELLAGTRHASASLRFAARLLGDDPALTPFVRKSDEQIVRELIVPSLPTAYARLLVEKGSSQSALAELKTLLEAARGKCNLAISWIEKYRTFTGAYDQNPDLVKIGDTSAGKALRALGAVLAIWEVGNGANALLRGEAEEALRHFVKGGPSAVAGFAEGVAAVRRIFQGVEKSEMAGQVVKIAGKVSAALGIVTGIIEAAGDLKDWDKAADTKVRVLGDLVGIGAGVCALVGFSAGGWVLGVTALGISFVADWLRDERFARVDADQKRRVLPALFPRDRALADTLAKANPAAFKNLRRDLRMFAPDIQRLAKVYPDGVTGERLQFWALQWTGLGVTQDIFGLTGGDVAGLAEAVAGKDGSDLERSYRVHFFAGYLSTGPGYDGFLSKDDALAWLAAQGSGEAAELALASSALDAATWQRMRTDAIAFLKSTQYGGPH